MDSLVFAISLQMFKLFWLSHRPLHKCHNIPADVLTSLPGTQEVMLAHYKWSLCAGSNIIMLPARLSIARSSAGCQEDLPTYAWGPNSDHSNSMWGERLSYPRHTIFKSWSSPQEATIFSSWWNVCVSIIAGRGHGMGATPLAFQHLQGSILTPLGHPLPPLLLAALQDFNIPWLKQLISRAHWPYQLCHLRARSGSARWPLPVPALTILKK